MSIPLINENTFLEKVKARENPFFKEYYALYSSWLGGIVKDPQLMLLPIDDHMVHRGDGVFEAMKVVAGSVYLMDEHLNRLCISAEKIALNLPFNINKIKEIILETLRAASQDNVLIRVFLSRGPGGFSVNPYEAIQTQLYVAITQLTHPALKCYEHGVVIGKSSIAAKPSWMAQIKSCNYLPNV